MNELDPQAPVGGALMSPGGAMVPVSPEEADQIKQAQEAAAKHKKEVATELVALLTQTREDVIRAKRHIEKRWIDDMRQIDGETRLMNTKEFPSQTNDDNAKPPVPHFTRSRCDLWESRMVDLLAPTSDPTWDLHALCDEDTEPPPGMDPNTWAEQIDQIKQQSEDGARRMRDVIRAQLNACNTSEVIRHTCRDATRIGTGVIMGPMNGVRIEHRFDAGTMKTTTRETTVPEIRAADPWCFYPDMVESADRAEFAFYVHFMSELDLWEFMENPGANRDEILALMKEKPIYGEIEESVRTRNQHSGFVEDIRNRHAVWRYTGLVSREYIEALGIEDEVPEGPISADIWFANDHILRARITALSAAKDYRIPYFVFAPFPIDDTMFGGSIPYLCRDSQRMATSAMWIMLHNASVSSGPQLFMRRGKIRPLDGKWSLRGPKIWDVLDQDQDLANIFASVNIENNVQQALGIFDLAKQMLDEELSTQQWASADTAEETETASGLAMLMNARTILQRRVCAAADDSIFRPMIKRFVLWNLLYNKRADIKGNYDVDPLCQSVRLVKDIQIQQKLFIATQIAPLNPGMFDQYGMIQDIVRALDVKIDSWMVPRDKWEQTSQQQQSQQQAIQQQMQMLQEQYLQAKTQHEHARAIKAFNEGQAAQEPEQPSADGTPAGISAERWLEHQEFLIEKQVQLHLAHGNLLAQDAANQTKQVTAAMAQQAQLDRNNSSAEADIRRNRTALMKTGVDAHLKLKDLGIKAAAAAAKPPPAPKAPFKAPRVTRYSGGKRPGY